MASQAQFEAAFTAKLEGAEFGLTKKDVRELLDLQAEVVFEFMRDTKANPYEPVTIRGLGKITMRETPAKARRKGINPFTQEEQWFAAKPKGRKMKMLIAKSLRDRLKAT